MATVDAGACSSLPAASVASTVGKRGAGPTNEPYDGNHRCPYSGCNKSYTKASKLVQHIRSHTGERPFVCDHDGCGASYMRNEHLKAHQRRHQDPSEKPFVCQSEGCQFRFWTTSQLKNHVQACHTDHLSSATGASAHDYPCTEPGCDQTFHKRKQLRQHIRDRHVGTPINEHESVSSKGLTGGYPAPYAAPLPFTCQYRDCGKSFPTNSKRKAHYRTHQEGRYTCAMEHTHLKQDEFGAKGSPIYSFQTWTALQKHMKEAHPPLCPWPGCGKHFQRQDNLRAHYRRHENRKLRLELEAKVLECSQENQLNHLRANLTDDSDASASEGEEHGDSVAAQVDSVSVGSLHCPSMSPKDEIRRAWQPREVTTTTFASATETPTMSSASSPRESPFLSEEQLIYKATHLRATRPRRGGVFRDLSSPALSVVTSMSEQTASVRPGSRATSLTSARGQATTFPCTWNGCSKVFTRKSTLSIHVRTAHLGERPFACPDCGRRFAHKHLVSRHRRICTGTPSSSEQNVVAGSRLRSSTSDELAVDDASTRANSGAEWTPFSATASVAGSDEESQHNESTSTPHTARQPSSTMKPRLLDLLTGRGYSAPENNCQSLAKDTSNKRLVADVAEHGDPTAKKRRTTRDRVFACPWTKISHELNQEMLSPARQPTLDGHAEQTEAARPSEEGKSEDPHCHHRFKRLYDLRRHLKSHHGLDLTTEELSAIALSTTWTNVN